MAHKINSHFVSCQISKRIKNFDLLHNIGKQRVFQRSISIFTEQFFFCVCSFAFGVKQIYVVYTV